MGPREFDDTKTADGSTPQSDEKPTTTTISTIAVRAAPHTTIVIAMLKSLGYVELRIDEMKPRLLEIGSNINETMQFLNNHNDLVARLRSKQDQVEELLSRADQLVTEQKDSDVIVYEAMAESLGVAWKELNRQLELRGYILEDTMRFYEEAKKHDQIVGQVGNLLRSALGGQIDANVAGQVNQAINDLINITASAIDLGSTIITQIRIVGSLADNAERPNETADACMLIEKVMLRLSKNWEDIESIWTPNKDKFVGFAPAQVVKAPSLGAAPLSGAAQKFSDALSELESWLHAAQVKFQQSQDQSTINILLQESKQQRENLKYLVQEIQQDSQTYGQLSGRITDLQNNIENFIKQLEERHGLFERIQQFFQNADSMLHQLSAMSADLINANASMAGELAPLARQKVMTVIEEGEKILRYGHNQQVIDRLNQLHSKLAEIEQLAQQRIQSATQQLRQQITSIQSWLKDVAEPFLASSGNMGSDLATSSEFLNKHKHFATEVVNKEHEIHAILSRAHELPEEDRRALRDFQQRYESVKQTLEWRIQLGNTYQQVQKFARELEGSFDSLAQLLSSNQNFANEQVAQQMVNVFHMIQETLSQERHQGEKFVSDAKSVGTQDLHLNVDQAIDSVRNILTEHESRFSQLTHKWQDWQKSKGETKKSISILEEVHNWQVDTIERIPSLEQRAERITSAQEREQIQTTLQRIQQEAPVQSRKIREVEQSAQEQKITDVLQRLPVVKHRQQEIETRVDLVQQKLQAQAQIEQNIRRTIEEIQQWQVDTFERIRTLDDHARRAQAEQEFEQIQTQISGIVQEVQPQKQRLQEVQKVVREQRQSEEVQRQVYETQARQEQLEESVQQVQQRVQAQQGVQQIRKTIEEIQQWQVDTFERIRVLDEQAQKAQSQQVFEQVSTQIERIMHEIPAQTQRIQSIQKVVEEKKAGGEIQQQVAETQQHQVELEETVRQVHQAVQQVQQAQKLTQELRKTIEEIQIWQVDTFERIRTIDEQLKRAETSQQQVEVEAQLQRIVQEVPLQSRKIQEVQKVVQEQRKVVPEVVQQQVAETSKRQEQLEQTIQHANILVQETQKLTQQLRKTIEEVQMWQVDTFERIRLVQEAALMMQTQEGQEQVQTQLQKIVQEIPQQTRKVEQVQKVVQEQRQVVPEPIQRQALETVKRQQEIEQTVQQTQQAVQQAHQRILHEQQVIEQQQQLQLQAQQQAAQQAQQQLQSIQKTIEEIQMWQEDSFQTLRTLEAQAAQAKTQQEFEQITANVHFIRQTIPQQTQKINDLVTTVHQQAKIELFKPVVELQKKQQQLEEALQAAHKKVEDQKQFQQVEEKVQKTVEEIQMWQVDTIGRIRLRESEIDKAQTVKEIEEVKERVEKTFQEVPVQQKKLQEVVREVRERGTEETQRKVAEVQSQQQEVETRLDRLYQKVLSPPLVPQKEALKRVVEEIQMWQEDVYEIIRVYDDKLEKSSTIQEREEVREKVDQTIREFPRQQIKLQEAQQRITHEQESEETVRKLAESQRRQQELEERLRKLQQKVSTMTEETFITQQQSETQKAPRLLSELRDAQVEEGTRFEFQAKIDAAPEPRVTWLKDGIDVRDNADYRTTFLNGTATLTIEETFIEDTAMYTLKAENGHGKAESSAKLIVKSKSQLGQQEAQKPRFVKQLQNVTVTEGETARLDCVVVAQPEPKVVWYKEEETVRESERIHLQFAGDHCSLLIRDATQQDQGLYKVKAQNIHGETTNFCRLTVQPGRAPQRVAPPTPPKPVRAEAPAFTPALVNQSVREGQQAVLQVKITGEPQPKVTWKFQDRPLQASETVRLVYEENGWSRVIIEPAQPQHSGLYMVEAVNEHGEARSGATLLVTTASEVYQTGKTTQDLSQEIVRRQIQQEGYWTDGAYTAGTPTPPPIPQHQRQVMTEEFAEHDVTDFGYSSIANAPEFIRPFQNEYTVNEGEKIKIDCEMVGNPRPKIHWFFNDKPIKSDYRFAEFINIGDTYSISFNPAKLENAGLYRMVAENVRGKTESATLIHVRPKSLIPQPTIKPKKPHTIEHQKVYEEFGATEYREIVPVAQKHQRSGLQTPPPAKRPHPEVEQQKMSTSLYHQKQDEFLDQYQTHEKQVLGHPPHFTQTLVSCVATVGDSAKFEGVVTGWPAPEVQWTKDGAPISKQTHPYIDFSNIGGRVSLTFHNASMDDAGKYMCTAKNSSGVATSSAQFVVRPKTIAPDFVKRLISEEIMEGDQLKWTVRITGDPDPKVTWLRDGQVIPDCEEVRLVYEGNGVHSMIIQRVELADSGQFTCLAENMAGEARSTADLVVRPQGTEPGSYFHITKVTQEKQVKGEEVSRNQTFSIENPRTTTPLGQ